MGDISILKEGVIKKFNDAFRNLSKALQDSTTQYALFRCRLRLVDEDVANILFLASDERGNWKHLDMDISFDDDNIYYSKGAKPFENEREILLQADNLINYSLESFPVAVGDIYWDINDMVKLESGFVVNTGEDDILVLTNNQLNATNACAGDAATVCDGDKILPLDWNVNNLQMYVDYLKSIESAKNIGNRGV